MGTADAAFEFLDAIAVVDGIQKAGDQVERLRYLKRTHIPNAEYRLRATLLRYIQHRLVDIQPLTLKTVIQEVTNMRAGTTGQVQVAVASVTEQLMQASDTPALRPVVDICTHQVIVPGQVRV